MEVNTETKGTSKDRYSDVPKTDPPPYAAATETQIELEPLRAEVASPVQATRPPPSSSPPPVHTRVSIRQRVMGVKQPLIIVGALVGITAVLICIILPMSFSTIEYYELGFRRRKSTGEIDRGNVYGPGGRHLLGPDYEFRTLPADAHFETFNAVSVFAKDRLQVRITAYMQYFLRKEQIHLLHKKYDSRYKPILLTNALNAIKNRATNFETREFIRNRTHIEHELFLAIREMLSGPCCEKDCRKFNTCIKNCKASACSEKEYGFYVDVRYFQLDALDIPDDLESKFLKGLVLSEESEAEKYKQNATVARKETDSLVKQIENEAREISQEATSQSELIRAVAKANATAIVENARSQGLKHLYSELAITEQKQKASFDYLRTLRGQENVHLAIDFNQLITGGGFGN